MPGQMETSVVLFLREDSYKNAFRFPKVVPPQRQDENLARTFLNLMFKGKTSAALDLLSQKGEGGGGGVGGCSTCYGSIQPQ